MSPDPNNSGGGGQSDSDDPKKSAGPNQELRDPDKTQRELDSTYVDTQSDEASRAFELADSDSADSAKGTVVSKGEHSAGERCSKDSLPGPSPVENEGPTDQDIDRTFVVSENPSGAKSDVPSGGEPGDRADQTIEGSVDRSRPGPSSDEVEKTIVNSTIQSTRDASNIKQQMNSPTAPDRSDWRSDDQDDRTNKTVAGLDQTMPTVAGADQDQKRAANVDMTVVGSGVHDANKTSRELTTKGQVDATIGSQPNRGEEFLLVDKRKRRELPTHIGRYEIQELLGEGTFGKVYKARDPQLDRIVAVKVAKSISGRTQIRRFLREARAAAQLRHPNIIPVYEYGEVDHENIIVYQFVEGETLKAYLKRHSVPPLAETVRIIREISNGLAYAHEQGIIHRDMKPDNILLDGTGRPHIADFGCARSMDDETHLTVDGSILGTPMYMSPEQAGGKAHLADGRTDIWSLGVMLYEMACGKRPFHGQLSDLLFWICNKDPSPIRKINPETPADIETICGKCLMREVDRRFQSASLLSDELGRYQRGEPIESRRIGTLKRTWMWAKRNQAVASLIATVLMTMTIASIVSTWFAVQAYREQRNRAFAQLNALTASESSALGGIFDSLVEFRTTIQPELQQRLDSDDLDPADRQRLQMAMLRLEQDPETRAALADELVGPLLQADAGDFFVCRECLGFRSQQLSKVLWNAAVDFSDNSSNDKRFRAAAALASYDPQSPKWDTISKDVAGYLTSINEIEMSQWLPSIRPIREQLKPALRQAFLDRGDPLDPTPQRSAAILARLFTDDVPLLVDLVPTANTSQVPYLTSALELNRRQAIEELRARLQGLPGVSDPDVPLETRQANLVTSLIQLGDTEQFSRLQRGEDLSVATELIERLGPAATSYDLMYQQVRNWKTTDADVLSAVLLSLGQFKQNQILDTQKSALAKTLLEIFRLHPDARTHSCARWLLSHLGYQVDVETVEQDLRRESPEPGMNWHVDLAGNTFALFGPVDSVELGLSKELKDRWSDAKVTASTAFDASNIFNEPSHRKRIPRRFGICIHEVTVQQYEPFQQQVIAQYQARIEEITAKIEKHTLNLSVDQPAISDDQSDVPANGKQVQDEDNAKLLDKLVHEKKRLEAAAKDWQRRANRRSDLDHRLPVGDVDYFSALGYCRWISEQMKTECGLPEVQQLQDLYAQKSDIKLSQAHLNKLGYRLPTVAEWEYACRGGTKTLFPFGQTARSAEHYAWFSSSGQLRPVGRLKPGNTGLFDPLGNVSEWCLDWYRAELPRNKSGEVAEIYVDFGELFANHQSNDREFRGGSFKDNIFDIRPTKRYSTRPFQGFSHLGFRLARTYEADTEGP